MTETRSPLDAVPLPGDDTVNLQVPDHAEVQIIGRGVVSVAGIDGRLTPVQHALLDAIARSMTEHEVDFDAITPITAAEYGQAMARRNLEFRTRMVHMMLLHVLVLRPLSLFETGYLPTGMGLFEYDMSHLTSEVAVRIADALYRGAASRNTVTGSTSLDFLGLDWFELAPLPVEEVREMFAIPPKSAAARAAGSVGPWEPGGISSFQLAEAEGRASSPHGASEA